MKFFFNIYSRVMEINPFNAILCIISFLKTESLSSNFQTNHLPHIVIQSKMLI